MDTIKVAKDYFVSSQNALLIPHREYGARKLIQVTGLPKGPINLSQIPTPHLPFKNSSSPSTSGRAKFLPTRHSDSSLLSHRRSSDSSSESSASASPRGHHNMKPGQKKWIHPANALLNGELSYTVKFLGECAVDQPKGTEVVKDAIRKKKFDRHLKRSEGEKSPKVNLIISANGLRIEQHKTKEILYVYPLHLISYCADDKTDKKMFTFIAREAKTTDHHCFVFHCSDKTAEEITLTVGQAFDHAYRRFLETAGEVDYKKQCLQLQMKVNSLQSENDALKKRVAELEKLKDRSDLEEYMKNNQLPTQSEASKADKHVFESNGFTAPVLSPPPPSTRQSRNGPIRQQSLPTHISAGAEADGNIDPFGMVAFNPTSASASGADIARKLSVDDLFGLTPEQELLDIQAGFSRGLSFGSDDFSLQDLDPLNQK